MNDAHLHVRPSGQLHTSAAEVLADPAVRKRIRRTARVMRRRRKALAEKYDLDLSNQPE